MKLKGYLKENPNGEFVVRFADIIKEIRPNFIDLPIENLNDYIGKPKHGDEVTFTVKTIATGTTEFDVIDMDVAVLDLGGSQIPKHPTLLDSIVEYHEDEEILKADGFDDAVIGIDLGTMRLVYSKHQKFRLHRNLLLKDYTGQFDVVKVPNITNICYGRDVGYKIEEIVLPKEIQEISATKIRKEMGL